MDTHCTYIPYSETGYFTPLVLDYLQQAPALQQFYCYQPDKKGIAQAISAREKYPVNRKVLAAALRKQYEGVSCCDPVSTNINALEQENTYTICTAHQPNLLTGYLYFIYKIAHAISLADELNKQYTDKHFVPVFYIGSEDNDLAELGTFRYDDKKYVWDADGQQGAVGRMDTKSLKPLLAELFKVLGPPGEHTDKLKAILEAAYLQHGNMTAATRHLVNELFGTYGLVVLDPDDTSLKKEFTTIMRDDLLQHNAYKLVTQQVERLQEQYKSQAYPRQINLFYLEDGVRERIERNGNEWTVLNTGIKWTENELTDELEQHPERFSPNVILRGLFQEAILPNVAFIGGGAEVAYWLQLWTVFEHYRIFFPVILLRQSVLLIMDNAEQLRQKTGLEIEDLFKSVEQLAVEHIEQQADGAWKTVQEQEHVAALLHQLKQKATQLDVTLAYSAEAVLQKIQYQLSILEKKMLRAEKRKHKVAIQRIEHLHNKLFPGGSLQERYENFASYYPHYGQHFIKEIVKNIEPLCNKFLVVTIYGNVNSN